jgi:hypothetical protein
MVEFRGLDPDFIREYCGDNLNNKSYIESIVNITSVFSAFNFDMLKALVEEMNRYNETPQEAMRILNVKAEFDGGAQYNVELYKGDAKAERVSPSVWNGAPLSTKTIDINYWIKSKNKPKVESTKLAAPALLAVTAEITLDEDEDEDESGWFDGEFGPGDLVKYDSKSGQFIFEKGGVTLILSKVKERYFNFDAF